MRATITLAAFAYAATLVSGTPLKARAGYAVKDSHFIPKRWTRVGAAPADHIVHLQIGLKQGRFGELERHLYEVSDPYHERYGNHLSIEEVNELVKPSDETSDLVHEWLRDYGIQGSQLDYSPAEDWINVKLPVSVIERLLDTEYSVYEHDDGGHVVRTPAWSLPVHLHDHISTIQPTNSFFHVTPMAKMMKPVSKVDFASISAHEATIDDADATVAKVCNTSAVTSLCLRTFYNTVTYTPQVPGENKVGLCNYLNETNNRSDVHLYLANFRPIAKKAAFTFETIIVANGSNQQTPNTPAQITAGHDLEGNLDAETILGIDYPTPLTAYNTGGMPPYNPTNITTTDTNEPYLSWLSYVLKQYNPPQTISTSYGDEEASVPLTYATTVCNQFAQLGARGISLLFGSGDSGVGPSGLCYVNGVPNFVPNFPSSCPYVTTVGATKNFNPEVAAYDTANGFASGGGFSNYFAMPSYQTSVVNAYIAGLKGEFSDMYNASGRAYPDVSAQGQRFLTVWDGQGVLLDGTSASTPTTAAIISLVNDALIANGKAPLGFLNPFIYAVGNGGFSDITKGSAVGCNGTGFPAAVGWDAVTGFGTPQFHKLRKAAMKAGAFPPQQGSKKI